MAEHSTIEWTDATWNPITGCQIVSPGCTNCYAMRLAGTRLQNHPSRAGLTQASKAGPVWNGQVRFNRDWLTQPLHWKKPRQVFVCAHGDLFADGVEDAWIDQIFAVMALSPQHTFQVLTKRPDRMRQYLTGEGLGRDGTPDVDRRFAMIELHAADLAKTGKPSDLPEPLPNVWLGVSAEDQIRADQRIPQLLATPAAKRFVSIEPLLGPIDLTGAIYAGEGGISMQGYLRNKAEPDDFHYWARKLDWVIVGGESGRGARPMHPAWAQTIRDDCAAAGTPFFFKQWGSWAPVATWNPRADVVQTAITLTGHRVPDDLPPEDFGGQRFTLSDKHAAGRLLDGVQHDGMPA
jgi:protein gp37